MAMFFLHVAPQSGTPHFWREPQSFGDLSSTGVLVHLNFNYLAGLLGDAPQSGTTLVGPENYDTRVPGLDTVAVQPFVEVVGGALSAQPPGPGLQRFLRDPLGDGRRLELWMPAYDATLGIGDNGGSYFRNFETSDSFHGGWDLTPRSQGDDADLFDVCAAAPGRVQALRKGPNSPIVLRHTVGGSDFLTIYQHLDLSQCPLKVDDPVRRGQFLASIDPRRSGGRRHLHFMAACGVDVPTPAGSRRLWFAIDSFGVYDYYLNRTDPTRYNYLPDLRPHCFEYPIRGAEYPIQWARDPLIGTLPARTTEYLPITRMQFRARRHVRDGVPPAQAEQCLVWLEGIDDFFVVPVDEDSRTVDKMIDFLMRCFDHARPVRIEYYGVGDEDRVSAVWSNR